MNIEEYEKMYNLENTYWWFQGRKKIIFELMRKYVLLELNNPRILDSGCGTGLILTELNKYGFTIGLDISSKALSYCKDRGITKLIKAQVSNLPIKDNTCDVVVSLDLLEHIENDNEVLKEYHRVLKKDGFICLTVPAHPFLWSEHDEALHHFRRYTKKEFKATLLKNNFKIVRYSYVISFTFFPIVIYRFLSKILKKKNSQSKTHIIPLPKNINQFLIFILKIEAFLLKFINLPIGVSLICIAKKNLMRNEDSND